MCFCTTWENRINEILHFYQRHYYYSHEADFVYIFVNLGDSLSNLFFQLPTANIGDISPLYEHRHAGAIIDCNLKKDYPILIFFWYKYS